VATPAEVQLAYSLRIANEGPDKLLVDVSGKREGSAAIAYGRGAAIAYANGDDATGDLLSCNLLGLSPNAGELDAKLPSLKEFTAGAQTNITALTEYRPGSPAGFQVDLPVSNAAGSYAFALDLLLRGNAAVLGGGEPDLVKAWGVNALEKAGFKDAAQELDAKLTQRLARAGASINP